MQLGRASCRRVVTSSIASAREAWATSKPMPARVGSGGRRGPGQEPGVKRGADPTGWRAVRPIRVGRNGSVAATLPRPGACATAARRRQPWYQPPLASRPALACLSRVFDARPLRPARRFRLLLRQVAGPLELKALRSRRRWIQPSVCFWLGPLTLRSGDALTGRTGLRASRWTDCTSAFCARSTTSRSTVKRRDAQLRGAPEVSHRSPLTDATGSRGRAARFPERRRRGLSVFRAARCWTVRQRVLLSREDGGGMS